VGTRSAVAALEKRKFSWPYKKSNPVSFPAKLIVQRCKGEWGYNSTQSVGKEPRVLIESEDEWAPEPVWMLRR
jgi:hypothetical protein